MNDIYIELKEQAEKYDQNKSQKSSYYSNSQRSSMMMKEEDQMAEFRQNAEKIRVTMQLIKQNNEEISEIKQQSARTTSQQKEKEIAQRLQQLANQNLKHTQNMKKLMENIDEDIKQSQQNNPGETETLAKIYQNRALQAEIKNLLSETQTIHTEYNKSAKKKLHRQLKMLDPDLSKSKINELLDDPNGLQKLMQEKTLGSASIQLKNAVDDILEKKKEIEKLERSHQKCFQLMSDIAFMVQAQGEMLNDIEQNLEGATNYIKKANKVLDKEKKIHVKNRKKLCCIIFMGLILVALITAPLWIKIIRNKMNSDS